MSEKFSPDPLATRAWTPPRVSGPLITFKGRTPGADEVENEARAAIQAGYQRGYSEGLAAAAAEVNRKSRQLDESIVSVHRIIKQMARHLERLDEAASGELARLAMTVASQLARRELLIDPAQIIAIIQDCLVELPIAQRVVKVHLHPSDAAVVRERLPANASEEGWLIIEDVTIGRGGARVVVESSQIDARLENRAGVAVQVVLDGIRGTAIGDITADIAADGETS